MNKKTNKLLFDLLENDNKNRLLIVCNLITYAIAALIALKENNISMY